jgi:hypothetical protein
VLNARRQCENVRQNNDRLKDRLKRRSKVLNARRLIVIVRQNIGRLKRRSNVLNARRLNGTV